MQQSFEHIQQSLKQLYEPNEIMKLTVSVLEYVTGFSQAKILTNKDIILSDNQHEKISLIAERLKNNEPLEYITGFADFFGLLFKVNEHTLIPRPETEELVDWIIRDNLHPSPRILDIGTGSGCIAVSLARNIRNSQVAAMDISAKAIETATKNAKKNQVQVDFIEKNILEENISFDKKFDVIVSNPPYVCEKEKAEMKENVLQYEPHSALFVPDENPLLFYEKIALFGKSNLSSEGNLYFEINRSFGKEIIDMLKNFGYKNIELRKDLCGNDRMIKAELK